MVAELVYELDPRTYREFYPRFTSDDFCYYSGSQ